MTPKEFRVARAMLELDQKQMAKMLGKSTCGISNYETGKTPIPLVVEKYLKLIKKK
jgi:DNA-binding transcriptional regulator YiaG